VYTRVKIGQKAGLDKGEVVTNLVLCKQGFNSGKRLNEGCNKVEFMKEMKEHQETYSTRKLE